MDFIKKLDLTPKRVLIMSGAALLGLIILVFALQLVASSFRAVGQGWSETSMSAIIPSSARMGGGSVGYDEGSYAYSYAKDMDASVPTLSVRNVAVSNGLTISPAPTYSTGDMAEMFEVTEYNASIETRHLEKTCGVVSGLKDREDVIFESSNTYDRGCGFRFKVQHQSVADVLEVIKGLNPKELSDNTYTIKDQVDDYTSEVEILQKKRASIDETLTSALSAYTEITRLATNTQNADALAKIIDSKIGIIERLTQERININEQLDRIARAKADDLDRLDYTTFSVSVYENRLVDGEHLVDSWKQAVQELVQKANEIIQQLTVGLVVIILIIVQWLIYAAIVLVVAKYGWKFAKYVWYR